MNTWPTAQFKYVARMSYGDTVPPDRDPNGQFLVFGSNGPFDRHSEANTLAPAIVVGRKGSFGKINWTDEPCFASDTTFFIDSRFTAYDLRWVYWLLQSLGLDAGSDDATVPGLNRETAYTRPVRLPPLGRQRAIADYLDRETARLDAMVAAKERLLELLAEKRRALITHAVSRGLNPAAPLRNSGIDWFGDIPARWKITRLKFIITDMEQGWSPQCSAYPAGPEDWGVVKAGCCNGGVFNPDENKALPAGIEPPADLEIHPGDVLMSRASGSRELIGSAAVVPEGTRSRLLLSDKTYRLRVQESVISPSFLVLVLGSNIGRYQIESAISGAEGLANNIGQGDIREFLIPVPSREEQATLITNLGASLRRLETLANAASRSRNHLTERRAAMIAAAVTGALDVEPAV